MRHCSRSLVLLTLLIASCGYPSREIEKFQCRLPYQLREAQLNYYRTHLSFRVSDPVRGLNNASIVPDTLLLMDASGRKFDVRLMEEITSLETHSLSSAGSEKIVRREFGFKLTIPPGASHALPEGNYTLRFSLANQGAVFPLDCQFSIVERTKDFSPGTFH